MAELLHVPEPGAVESRAGLPLQRHLQLRPGHGCLPLAEQASLMRPRGWVPNIGEMMIMSIIIVLDDRNSS